MIRIAIAVMMMGFAALAEDASTRIPELGFGDILLCSEYPYRSVQNTDLTMYQLARLGFQDARQFQDKHGLKADNVIGPATQAIVQEEYGKAFGTMPTPTTNLVLAVSAAFAATGETCLVRVCIANASGTAIRLRGLLECDRSDRIMLAEPSVTAKGKVCTRRGGKVGCGSWSLKATLGPRDTVLRPNGSIEHEIRFARLKANQDGRASLTLRYLDASGAVHELATELATMPKEGK